MASFCSQHVSLTLGVAYSQTFTVLFYYTPCVAVWWPKFLLKDASYLLQVRSSKRGVRSVSALLLLQNKYQ